MNKDLLLSLLRKALAYGGGFLTSSGLATHDEITASAGALVTLVGVAWSVWGRHRAKVAAAALEEKAADPEHHTIGMPPANLLVLLLCLPMLSLLPACSTVTTTAGDGTVTTGKQADWETINHVTRVAAKYAAKAVLDANPGYAESVDVINESMAALFAGVPTAESLSGTLAFIAPDLADADVTLIVSVLLDAWELYAAKTGNTVLIPLDPNVQALVAALTTGIHDGIALHYATLP
ncbi:hypothetical protein OpiT1DRAFT_03986 [Opitutaceae bacterium TAV1]|nr:hypothetical protein OpiT1DRAFT_03986 [Opitutaceae bacterium TAV1]